jgi:hypothetical protein
VWCIVKSYQQFACRTCALNVVQGSFPCGLMETSGVVNMVKNFEDEPCVSWKMGECSNVGL